MKTLIVGLTLLVTGWLAQPAMAQSLINGAGATFPYPLYSKWFSEYAKIDPGEVQLPVDRQRRRHQADHRQNGRFRSIRKSLTDEELKTAPAKIIHIPTVMGAVVVTYNLPGVARG